MLVRHAARKAPRETDEPAGVLFREHRGLTPVIARRPSATTNKINNAMTRCNASTTCWHPHTIRRPAETLFLGASTDARTISMIPSRSVRMGFRGPLFRPIHFLYSSFYSPFPLDQFFSQHRRFLFLRSPASRALACGLTVLLVGFERWSLPLCYCVMGYVHVAGGGCSEDMAAPFGRIRCPAPHT